MQSVIFGTGLVVFVLIILAFAFGPILKPYFTETVPAFIGFFFLLLGLRMMLSPTGPEGNVLLGDFLASLALTYFWVKRRK
jgi:hypothetical protein